MRSEYVVRDHLAQLDDEYQWMTDRFLRSEKSWSQDVYTRALVEIGVRRSMLRWVLDEE